MTPLRLVMIVCGLIGLFMYPKHFLNIVLSPWCMGAYILYLQHRYIFLKIIECVIKCVNKVITMTPLWVWGRLNINVSICILANCYIVDSICLYYCRSFKYNYDYLKYYRYKNQSEIMMFKIACIIHANICKTTKKNSSPGLLYFIPYIIMYGRNSSQSNHTKACLDLFSAIRLYKCDIHSSTWICRTLANGMVASAIESLLQTNIPNLKNALQIEYLQRILKIVKKHPDLLTDVAAINTLVDTIARKKAVKEATKNVEKEAHEALIKLAVQYKQSHKTDIRDTCGICMCVDKEMYRYDCVTHMFCLQCTVDYMKSKIDAGVNGAPCPLCTVPHNQYYAELFKSKNAIDTLLVA